MKTTKVTKLVLKLIKLTKAKEIDWETMTTDEIEYPSDEVILGKIFKTSLSQGIFCLYRYKYKNWIYEDEYVWAQRIQLNLIDDQGKTNYEFEYTYSINDLYEIVTEISSDVDGIIDSILEDE